MRIHKGDNIIVISGSEKGKMGQVSRVLAEQNAVIIPGFNLLKRHQKARKAGQKGQIVERSLPIDVSNVLIADPKTGKPSRIGKKKEGDKIVRIAKKSGVVIG